MWAVFRKSSSFHKKLVFLHGQKHGNDITSTELTVYISFHLCDLPLQKSFVTNTNWGITKSI